MRLTRASNKTSVNPGDGAFEAEYVLEDDNDVEQGNEVGDEIEVQNEVQYEVRNESK